MQFQPVFAKDLYFEPKIGHCTVANENLEEISIGMRAFKGWFCYIM
jgi:hypothetical protein